MSKKISNHLRDTYRDKLRVYYNFCFFIFNIFNYHVNW